MPRTKKRRVGPAGRGRAKLQSQVILCTVCGKGDGKYKCPQCRAPFCCVQCSKDHKANHCTAKTTSATASTADGVAGTHEKSNYLPRRELNADKPTRRRLPRVTGCDESDSHDDEPGWNITPEMRDRLRRSAWLRKELQDGGLRQLIAHVDAASDVEEEDPASTTSTHRGRRPFQRNDKPNTNVTARELALARTRHSHRKFSAFVDRVMLTAGVLQPEGGDGTDLDLVSVLKGADGPGPLVLTPAPTKGTQNKSCHSESESNSESCSGSDESSKLDNGESSDSDDGEVSDSDSSNE